MSEINIGYKIMSDAEPRDIPEELKITYFTLNTWTPELKEQIKESLRQGKWVRLGSKAIGHTRAEMTEAEGLGWIVTEYGEAAEFAIGAWGIYAHLKGEAK